MAYTVLTVFDESDTIDEPVMSLPLAGRMSFRQLGITAGLAILLPMAIYSTMSDIILAALPDPLVTIEAVSGAVPVTWDIVISLLPVVPGLALGLPRPKLVPMDRLILHVIRFALPAMPKPKVRPRPAGPPSTLAGFAVPDTSLVPDKAPYAVAVSGLGVPSHVTITLYDDSGRPLAGRLARAYVDDELLCSVTADSDGTIGMVYVPKSEGSRKLVILVDGIERPVVDTILEVSRSS